MAKATFAAGCFWGIEVDFRNLPGVLDTAVGYEGGHSERPSYEDVCSGRTGHAEAVEVWFDPATLTYTELLETFWRVHNPTTRNRQGWDIGSQYRSVIFVHNPEQQQLAVSLRDAEQHKQRKTIVTEIEAAPVFYRAEEYHQRYFEKQGRTASAATCVSAATT